VVLGIYAAKRHTWAFVAGLVLYAIRTVLQFMEFFSPITLLIRAFLMFRIFQGLQACVALNQSVAATKALLAPRRFEMPQASPLSATVPTAAAAAAAAPPVPVAQPWMPSRVQAPEGSDAG
jgi:hypothetical protein